MMHNKKKIAMLIVQGLKDFDKDYDSTEEQQIKTPEENAESDDSRMGIEIAMEKFISAIKDNDTKKAVEAMLEFQEMCSGVEYHQEKPETSMHED